MRQRMLIFTKIIINVAVLMNLAACDKVVDGSNTAASITGQALNDAANTWREAFTLHPPAKPGLPQTRYCYKNMDDIVCYDSVQPSLTARLVGFQDGNTVSWVQQGGGSMGVSGGPPVAYNEAQVTGPTKIIEYKTPIEANPGVVPTHNTGEIIATSLPPH